MFNHIHFGIPFAQSSAEGHFQTVFRDGSDVGLMEHVGADKANAGINVGWQKGELYRLTAPISAAADLAGMAYCVLKPNGLHGHSLPLL